MKDVDCTDCERFSICWLRRHKNDNKPCKDIKLEESETVEIKEND